MADILDTPVVLGAGPVGRSVAAALVARGIRPRVVTRSGTAIDGTQPCRADVADPDATRAALARATVVFQCAQPSYHRWPQDFPAIQRSVVRACEASGAVLVAIENLYGYGPVPVPMTEDRPMKPTTRKSAVRAAMWAELLDAHQSGRVRATAVRASDFFGAGVRDSAYGMRFFGPLVSGGKAQVLGSPQADPGRVPQGRTHRPVATRPGRQRLPRAAAQGPGTATVGPVGHGPQRRAVRRTSPDASPGPRPQGASGHAKTPEHLLGARRGEKREKARPEARSARRLAIADLRFAAWFLWMTPLATALSSLREAVRIAVVASSTLPRLDGLAELPHVGAELGLDGLVALVRLLVRLDALDLRLDVRHADTSFVGLKVCLAAQGTVCPPGAAA